MKLDIKPIQDKTKKDDHDDEECDPSDTRDQYDNLKPSYSYDFTKLTSPYDESNFISKYITFWWVYPLLLLGWKSDIEVSDLRGTPEEDKSRKLGNEMYHDWQNEIERARRRTNFYQQQGRSIKKKPNLLRVIIKRNTFWFFMSSLWILTSYCVVSPLQAIILGQLIQDGTSYSVLAREGDKYTNELNSLYTRIVVAGIMVILTSFVQFITLHPYYFCIQHLGMKIRIASCNLVYRKSLRLSKSALANTTVGQIVNLLSNDVNRFDIGLLFIPYLLIAPIQAIIIVVILSKYYLGFVPTISGFSLFLLYLPFQGFMGKWFGTIREETAIRTDERIRLMNEIVPAMRVIKMYAWEKSFAKLVDYARRKEVKWLRYRSVLTALNESLYFISSKLIILICILTLVLMGYELTAEAAFVTIALLDTLRLNMTLFFPMAIASIAETVVSCDRLTNFLLLGEQPTETKIINIKRPEDDPKAGSQLAIKRQESSRKHKASESVIEESSENSSDDLIQLDESKAKDSSETTRMLESEANNSPAGSGNEQKKKSQESSKEEAEFRGIKVSDISTAWIADDQYDRNGQEIVLSLKSISFTVKPGDSLVIVGRVGSGKSSILMSIMGELPIISGSLTFYGRISYASQEPWIFSGTVEDNILFGKDYDDKRFQEVIQACALSRDLELFPNGRNTIVGERGISMSGGQKARVNLARALYRDADLYLLDDPLSAVDALVAKHIFENCIKGYLKEKTVILVTHQIQFAKECNQILVIDQGRQIAYGPYKDLSKQLDLVGFSNAMSSFKSESESDQPPSVQIIQPSSSGQTSMGPPVMRRGAIGSNLERSQSLSKHSGTQSSIPEAIAKEKGSSVTGSKRGSLVDGQRLASGRPEDYKDSEDELQGEAPMRQTQTEDLSEVSVDWRIYLYYLACISSISIIVTFCVSNIVSQILFNGSDFYLSFWTDTEQRRSAYKISRNESIVIPAKPPTLITLGLNIDQVLASINNSATDTKGRFLIENLTDKFTVEQNGYIYTSIIIVLYISCLIRTTSFFISCMKASVNIHNRLFKSVMDAPIKFFDFNPIGILLNRVSRDMGIVDDRLPQNAFDVFEIFTSTIGIAATVAIVDYINLVPAVGIIVMALIARRLILRTINRMKEMEGILRSQVFTHLSSTLSGLSTIRSFQLSQKFIDVFDQAQDEHTVAWFTFFSTGQWLGFTLDLICMTFIIFVIVLLTTTIHTTALTGSGLGLAISSAIIVIGPFQWGIRQLVELESNMVSVKRIREYSNLPKEAAMESEPHRKPPRDWPQRGSINFEQVSLSYFEDEKPVLRELTFQIQPGEKVGIVGRTGAGKSSIVTALFRMTEPSGMIKIDSIDIQTIGLNDLRRSISIIPQEPILFNGTMRFNLDPFDEHDDGAIWSALDAVRLKHVTMALENGLDGTVNEGGQNFSVGQRQLICLARAILRRNRILVLDEATANVDPETDTFIQKTIRDLFKECTVITIAHRLNTIMDSDRVLVLDAGQVKEFDEPHVLLTQGGLLATMTANTGQQADKLRRVAERAYKRKHNIKG